jgi:hypothetical protein
MRVFMVRTPTIFSRTPAMDKKSVMYAAGALVIILVLALVVKPLVTGQPLNTGLPLATTAPTGSPVSPTPVITVPPATIPQGSPTQLPSTAVPTWDNMVLNIGFVNPSTYGISLDVPLPNGTRFNTTGVNTSMTSYAKISGKYSGTTQIITIPFPYWDLVYTVDPVPASEPGSVQVVSTSGTGISYSGVQGSYSGVIPQFSVQVVDAADPNRIVRTFSPPGGINQELWTATSDPRPWTEKFYEGQRSYYFIIKSTLLNSYTIDIRVPTQYIGRY